MLIPGDSRVQGGGRTSLLVERKLCFASMLVEKYSILASSFMEERVVIPYTRGGSPYLCDSFSCKTLLGSRSVRPAGHPGCLRTLVQYVGFGPRKRRMSL